MKWQTYNLRNTESSTQTRSGPRKEARYSQRLGHHVVSEKIGGRTQDGKVFNRMAMVMSMAFSLFFLSWLLSWFGIRFQVILLVRRRCVSFPIALFSPVSSAYSGSDHFDVVEETDYPLVDSPKLTLRDVD